VIRGNTTAYTLRSKINRLTCLTVGIVGIIVITVIFTITHFKSKVRIQGLVNSLFQSSRSQVDLLVPTFILPEQKEGTRIVLKKIEQDDSLEHASILSSEADLPKDFSSCQLSDKPSYCVSQDGKHIGTVMAIGEGDQVFGYLFKAKGIDNIIGVDQSLPLIKVTAGVLILTFLSLFWGMTRITARDVPDALKELASWVESVLNDQGHSSLAPNLKFKELNELGSKIAQIIEQHAMTRDQAVIGQITSGVMHDIRTPLQPLMAAVELADEKEGNESKRLKYLENLLSVSRSKLPVINEIVETTLDGVRKIKLNPTKSNLNETIRRAISLSAEVADLKNTELDFIEAPSQPMVLHDPTQMTRVFSNLIKNGVEAQAKLLRSRIRITVTTKSDGPIVLIEDGGPGLSGKPDKIFHAFKSTKARGTGLGLHISWKIVEAHGGTIVVGKSTDLGGAQFEVSLPVQEGTV
jgi:signal transduction histidine kinase